MAPAVLLLVQGDLDQRAVAHHHLVVGPAKSSCPPASQAAKAARQAGHSEAMIENQAVSRLRPLSTRWGRNRPSNVNPKRSAARLEPAFSLLHFHSRRRLPRSSNACLAITKMASVA